MKELVGRCLLASMAVLYALSVPGCESDEPAPCRTFRGECVGVPSGEICDDSPCTDGVSCSEIVELEDGDDLASAATGQSAGTCIALDEGSYGSVTLPSGVSLLGVGADHVEVGAVTVAAGDDRVLRGFRTSNTVDVAGGAKVHIEAVRIASGTGNGIQAGAGADITITTSEIREMRELDPDGSAGPAPTIPMYGIVATDAALVVERSIVEDNAGPGIWAACTQGCACAPKPPVRLERSLVQRNQYVGVALEGVAATLAGVDVLATAQRDYQFGGGLLASRCTELTATSVHIEASADFGVFLHNSSGSLGGVEEAGIIVIGSRIGIWAHDIGANGQAQQSLVLENVTIQAASGVGIGLSGDSKGIIVIGSKVGGTQMANLPVFFEPSPGEITSGKEDVGDGLLWTEGVTADIDGLTLEGNARNSILIHGAVGPGSRLANLVLAGGDELKGIVQQSAETGVEPPATVNAPSVQQTEAAPFGVAAPPAVPGKL